MARRVTRPPPAGMPKFKLEIPTEAPVTIEAEKVNVNEVGAVVSTPTQPNPTEQQQQDATAVGVPAMGGGAVAAPPSSTGGASSLNATANSTIAAATSSSAMATGKTAAAPTTAASARGGITGPPPPLARPVLTAASLAALTAARLNNPDQSSIAPSSSFVGIDKVHVGSAAAAAAAAGLASTTTSSSTAFTVMNTARSSASTRRAVIQLDETLVSPVVAMGFHDPSNHMALLGRGGGGSSTGVSPTTALPPGVSPTTAANGAFPNANSKKFYQVQQSNLYVFEEGAPLVREDGNFAYQEWSELTNGGGEVNRGIAGGLTSSSTNGTTIGSAAIRRESSDDMTTATANNGGSGMYPRGGGGGGGGSSSFGMGPPSHSNTTAVGEGDGGGGAEAEEEEDDADASPYNSNCTYTAEDYNKTSTQYRRQQLHQQQLLLSPKKGALASPAIEGLHLIASTKHSRNNRRREEYSGGTGGGGGGSVTPPPRSGTASPAPTTAAKERTTIYLNQLELLEKVGAGQQGSVFKCQHKDTRAVYALKKLSMAAIKENPDPIERQARKASIVRELKMLTECKGSCDQLVALHNAYFQNDELMVLMEWMGTNVEELMKLVARVPQETVQHLARDSLQRGYGGDRNYPTKIKNCGGESVRLMERARVNRATAFPEVIAAVITADVLKGLHYLHKKLRIVHTDLKPANILLTTDNTLGKIADFGCSMRLGEDGKVRYKGVTLGTKLYMPPDRVNSLMMAGPEDDNSLFQSVPFANNNMGTAAYNANTSTRPTATIEAFKETMSEATSGAFDEKADIWSFGIVLLELVNGCHPCQALARDNYWNYANDLRFPKMIQPPQMSDLLYNVLQKCLAVDPAKRPSAEEILQMPFYQKYKDVDRKKFAHFVDKLKKSAAGFELENRRRELQKQIKVSITNTTSQDYQSFQSKSLWAKHNNYLDKSGLSSDNFPALPGM